MRTYLDYVNLFWRKNREHFVGVHTMAVYFHLLEVCNHLGWPKNFRQADRFIAVRLQISENTVKRAKRTLAKIGLISFKIPPKTNKGLNGSTSYSFIVQNTRTVVLNDGVDDTDYNGVYGVVDNVDNDSVDSSVYGADSSANTLDIDIDKDYIKKEDKSSKKAKSKKSIENPENENAEKLSGEGKTKTRIFVKPTVDEIQEFLNERGGPPIDAEYFFNHYEANGWIVGKAKMKDWKATVRNWQKRDFTHAPTAKEVKRLNHPMTNYSGQNTNADDRF